MNDTYKQTILTVAVHRTSENPVFDECVTHVCVDDEAGGWFIKLKQDNAREGPQELRFDYKEFLEVAKAVKALFKQGTRE